MSATVKVERLEALLGRIQKNAELLSRERTLSVQSAPAAAAETGSTDVRSVPPVASVGSVPPEEVEMQTIPPEEVELESIAPEAVDMQSLPPEAGDEALSDGRESVPPPAESEVPSDIELELTEDLSNTPDDFSFQDEEQAPRSSEKSKELEGLGASLGFHAPGSDGTPSSIGEAVERAATDVPVRTPPPESGPQVSIPPKGYEDYEPELDSADEPLSSHVEDGPTVSQLGTTVDLEPGDSVSEELELVTPTSEAAEPEDEFEANLPGTEFGGGYDESLAPPENAREELDGYDQAQREREARRSVTPGAHSQPPPAPVAAEGASETVARPSVDVTATPALFEGERPAVEPLTFAQRLDDALRLGS